MELKAPTSVFRVKSILREERTYQFYKDRNG